jgi:ATP-binding cassette subfamily B protein
VAKREFTLEDEHQYNRSRPVRWIVSHAVRYPLFPLLMVLAAIFNNLAYSYIQVLIGRAFDLITTPGWAVSALAVLALSVVATAIGQGVTGLTRNYAGEFLAQRVERDARDELYVSLLGKSQTFHGRQRIGDIMARATNDVRMLNLMFSPGLMLIIDSTLAAIVPIIVISPSSSSASLTPGCCWSLASSSSCWPSCWSITIEGSTRSAWPDRSSLV